MFKYCTYNNIANKWHKIEFDPQGLCSGFNNLFKTISNRHIYYFCIQVLLLSQMMTLYKFQLR